MGLTAQQTKALALRRANPFQQFGQGADYYTFDGSTGCTHTVLEYLGLLWFGKLYTHDAISKIVGYPAPPNNPNRRGLYPSEVQKFCNAVGLPYVVKFGLTAASVRATSAIAPVGFGHAYSYVPEWKGFTYYGVKADGLPNGYAAPAGMAGKTQLKGFTGAHFGCALADGIGSTGPQTYYWEPNHGSAARPEKPAYDICTPAQFDKLYNSYKTQLGRSLYALVPTRSLPL